MNKSITKSDFMIVEVDLEEDIVFLIDLDLGKMSVTNDAEAVWCYIQKNWPGKRVVYKDSMGYWDEIVMADENSRADFVAYHGELPKV
jgi:hypothetical protein